MNIDMNIDGLPHLAPRVTEGRRLGATVVHPASGSDEAPATRFEVWAPWAATVALHLDPADGTDNAGEVHQLARIEPGYWGCEVPGVGHGARYRYSLDGADPIPEPASAWQPDGVHGPSAVVDTARFDGTFEWTDHEWRGLPMERTVLYELHIGTFTGAGTFDAAIDQLDRLADLGITTIEVMPVNAFPGERNWGYDGVFPFAVQESYGGPVAFARFVDAAHQRGLAVVLDVVYNHLGPEGAVMGRYAPYFTEAYRTPWGDAINVMGPGSDGVRRFVLENIHRWVTEFHVDGFRLDAVHAVIDSSANPFWEQVADTAHRAGRAVGRSVVVIAESSDNDPRYVRAGTQGGYGHDAVWNDDLHHCLRVAVTGEQRGYYADYEGNAAELADVLEHRWKFRGGYSIERGRHHGRPVDDVAPHRFVVCSQNHDQVGNRAAGDRLDHHVSAADRRLLAAIVALSPFTPMLFMGEEYGETAPFPFFVDHGDPEILEATRVGRREEFADADWDGEVPDPADPATFAGAVLDPALGSLEPHRNLLAMYTRLLALRRDVGAVASLAARQRVERTGELIRLDRWLPGDTTSSLLINLGPTAAATALLGGTVAFDSADAAWGGPGGGLVTDEATDTAHVAPRTVGLLIAHPG